MNRGLARGVPPYAPTSNTTGVILKPYSTSKKPEKQILKWLLRYVFRICTRDLKVITPPLRIALFACLAILFSGCFPSNHVHWEYVIATGYEGWLIIQYECPGGTPLNRNENHIQVEYDSEGFYCTSDSSFAWSGTTTARNTERALIPSFGPPWKDNTGYGICCGQSVGSHRTIGGIQRDWTYDLQWVGTWQGVYPNLDLDQIVLRLK